MAHTIPLTTPLDDSGLTCRPAPPAPRAITPADPTRYNHPNFLDIQPGKYGGTTFRFKAFTGLEPKPEYPAAANDDAALTWAMRGDLLDQYEAARVLWSKARLRHEATPLLRKAAPLWTAWTTAWDELTAVFEQFRTVSDGHWRAQLLRLTDAEDAATAAADAFDGIATQLAQAVDDQISVAGREEEVELTTLAQELGIDASDWVVHSLRDYTYPLPNYRIVRGGIAHYGHATPLAAAAARLIADQRERLRQVADLAGDLSGAATR
ncbi:hypothetical protein ABIE67_009435 [Streptomyces sp. V4I8]|uniref:hypothetical protein n=1 Tax=Streptomyces sp. V4I8 TaxID=3156469 RepID=UPI00351398B4